MDVTEELQKAAVPLGYIGLITHKDTLQKGYDHAIEMAGEAPAVAVAIHTVINTWALRWADERLATIAFLQDAWDAGHFRGTEFEDRLQGLIVRLQSGKEGI